MQSIATHIPQSPALPVTLRARVWVQARHFYSRAEAQALCWLWLLADDGRLHVLRMDAVAYGDDSLLATLLLHLTRTPDTAFQIAGVPGMAIPLPSAPVVPVPRWSVSWGHPLQQAIRAFAEHLDGEVLVALGKLEVPGPFLGSVGNYNRLARLPPRIRRNRMQALELFPPLVAPLLLDGYRRPELLGADGDNEPLQCAALVLADTSPVLDAIDRGRDVIGALADWHRIDRALVRAPLMREPWAEGRAPGEVLRLLHAMPAHARPRRRLDVESRLDAVAAIPARNRCALDVTRLAGAFAAGWTQTWRALDAEFAPLRNALRDTRDFLRSALEQANLAPELAGLDAETLALGWIARRGIAALLHASRRWHAQPLIEVTDDDGLPDEIAPLFDTWECARGRAVELTSRRALREEGETMRHCVGGYWDLCVLEGVRIVHLALADGETATAQFVCDFIEPNPCFDMCELAGPGNAECSNAMALLAQDVGYMIGSNRVRARRAEVLAAVRRARETARPGTRRTLRLLDRRSRAELAQVLAYCAQQPDWCGAQAIVQRGAIAGHAYADGPRLLAQLQTGDALQLAREPGNPHDAQAVRIDWHGRKLGYVPRSDNAAIARLLDAGVALEAKIAAVQPDTVWAPVEFTIVRATTASCDLRWNR